MKTKEKTQKNRIKNPAKKIKKESNDVRLTTAVGQGFCKKYYPSTSLRAKPSLGEGVEIFCKTAHDLANPPGDNLTFAALFEFEIG